MILRGTPLVPGRVRGRLADSMEEELAGRILLLGQGKIPTLLRRGGTPPAGLIVRDAARFGHVLIRLFSLAVPTHLLEGSQSATLVPGRDIEMDGGLGLLGDEALPPSLKPAEGAQ